MLTTPLHRCIIFTQPRDGWIQSPYPFYASVLLVPPHSSAKFSYALFGFQSIRLLALGIIMCAREKEISRTLESWSDKSSEPTWTPRDLKKYSHSWRYRSGDELNFAPHPLLTMFPTSPHDRFEVTFSTCMHNLYGVTLTAGRILTLSLCFVDDIKAGPSLKLALFWL